MKEKCTVGVVGFGRFGRLMTRYLALDFPVSVYNRSDRRAQIARAGARPASLAEVCALDVVILSVPISALEQMLAEIAPMLKPDAVVVDVCSVKELPVGWMREKLPETVSILATHPMFGPDSAADTLEKGKIVLCKERIDEQSYRRIKQYLASRGLIVIETSPADHDRQIAVSLALTHFIGRSLSEFGAKALDIDTEGYKRLLHTLGVVEHDTWQLFEDMHRYNRYAAGNRKAFMAAMERIHGKLG